MLRASWTARQAAAAAPRCCRPVKAEAGKGFGTSTPSPPPKKQQQRRSGTGGGKVRRRQTQFIEDEQDQRQQQQAPNQSPMQPGQASAQRETTERFRNSVQAQQSGEGGSDSDFERRLSLLAERTPAQLKVDAETVQQDILALEPQFGRVPSPQEERGVRPATPVADSGDGDGEKPSLLVQGAAGVGALALVGIFLAGSFSSDFVASTSPAGSGSGGAARPLGEEQRKELAAQAARFDDQLAAAPDSVEALEGAAVSYARLGDWAKGAELLTRLTKAKPDDAEVWRLLGETQAVQGQLVAAAASFETANAKTGGKSIDVLGSWTDALIADGKPQKAVAVVDAAKAKASKELAVDLDLLLGRVYSQWKGHNAEALALYDRLAESNPDDFRAPLAKGLILKSEGRKGDAARYFMKARYLAPPSSRAAVDDLLSRQQ